MIPEINWEVYQSLCLGPGTEIFIRNYFQTQMIIDLAVFSVHQASPLKICRWVLFDFASPATPRAKILVCFYKSQPCALQFLIGGRDEPKMLGSSRFWVSLFHRSIAMVHNYGLGAGYASSNDANLPSVEGAEKPSKMFAFDTDSKKIDNNLFIRSEAKTPLKFKNLREVERYLKQDRDFRPQCREIIREIVHLHNLSSPWYNSRLLKINVMNLINFNECDGDYLGEICVFTHFMNQYIRIPQEHLDGIEATLRRLFKTGERTGDRSLIRFLYLSNMYRDSAIIDEIHRRLNQRIENINPIQIKIYIKMIQSRIFPTEVEIVTLQKFMEKLERFVEQIGSTDKLEPKKHLLEFHLAMRRISISLYTNSKVKQLIEREASKILSKVDNELDIFTLASSRTPCYELDQKFILEFIDRAREDGTVPYPADFYLKVLSKMITRYIYKQLEPAQKRRLFQFFLNNLSSINELMETLVQDFMPKEDLTNLHSYILKSQFKQTYMSDPSYIYFMLERKVVSAADCAFLLGRHEIGLKFAHFYPELIYISLILQEVKDSYHNDEKFMAIRNEYIDRIREIGLKITNIYLVSKNIHNSIYAKFARAYGHLFLDHHMEHLLANKDQHVNKIFFFFLFYSNQKDKVVRLMEDRNEKIAIKYMDCLIEKACTYPHLYRGIYKLFNQMVENSRYGHRLLSVRIKGKYICNWRVHINLNQDEIQSFLQLTIKFAKNELFPEKCDAFICYFLETPLVEMKCYREYEYLVRLCLNNLAKAKNINISIVARCIEELISLNRLKKEECMLIMQLKFKEILLCKEYCMVVVGKNVHETAESLDRMNIVAIVRNQAVREEILETRLAKILRRIQSMEPKELESCLVNFTMKTSRSSRAILRALLQSYIGCQQFQRCPQVIRNLSSQITEDELAEQYRQLLQGVQKWYRKRENKLPDECTKLIVQEYVRHGVVILE